MTTPAQKTALVTGGSSGIGLELARLFARDGYQVVLVARGAAALADAQQALTTASGASVASIAMDLSVPDASLDLMRRLEATDTRVDILVNNAAFGIYGLFAQTDLEQEVGQLQLNVVGLTQLTKLCLRGMLDRAHGRILNVASTAAFGPGPLMAVYYASKAYMLSLSQALSAEVAGTGVTVTALCPGPTWSAFQARAGIEHIRLLSRGVMTSEAVARIGYAGLMRGERLVVPGWQNQLMRLGATLSPTGPRLRVLRYLQAARTARANRAGGGDVG